MKNDYFENKGILELVWSDPCQMEKIVIAIITLLESQSTTFSGYQLADV